MNQRVIGLIKKWMNREISLVLSLALLMCMLPVFTTSVSAAVYTYSHPLEVVTATNMDLEQSNSLAEYKANTNGSNTVKLSFGYKSINHAHDSQIQALIQAGAGTIMFNTEIWTGTTAFNWAKYAVYWSRNSSDGNYYQHNFTLHDDTTVISRGGTLFGNGTYRHIYESRGSERFYGYGAIPANTDLSSLSIEVLQPKNHDTAYGNMDWGYHDKLAVTTRKDNTQTNIGVYYTSNIPIMVRTAPTASTIISGQKLSNSTISDGIVCSVVANNTVGYGSNFIPQGKLANIIGNFRWSNPDSIITSSSNVAVQFDPWFSNFNQTSTNISIPVRAAVISLNANGGSGGSSYADGWYNSKPAKIIIPARAGFTFKGYYSAASGGTRYYDDSGNSVRNWDIAADTSLYAQWEEQCSISNITPPAAITTGSKLVLGTPLVSGTAITQGWQYSANASTNWTAFSPSSKLFTTSENAYYIRYYATNRTGTTYSNSVQITVNKHKPSLSISATPASASYPANVVLTASLTGADSLINKAVKFYNGANYLGTSGTDAYGKASFTVINPAVWTHSYQAVFDEDAINSSASSSPLSHIVSKGTQSELSFANASDIIKTYGNPEFTLPTVSGGSGTGAFSYRSSNPDVATVSGSYVSIKAAGEAIIYVKKLGDENYELSAEASIKVTALPKTITISGISAHNKTYDGNKDVVLIMPTMDDELGIVTGDNLTVNATGQFSDKDAGSNKIVSISGFSLGGADAANYRLATGGHQLSTTASIRRRAILVSPNNLAKNAGQSDPPLTYTHTGAISEETVSFSGSLARSPGETAGEYPVSAGTLALMDNGLFSKDNYELGLSPTIVIFTINKVTATTSDYQVSGNEDSWNNSDLTLTPKNDFVKASTDRVNWSNSLLLNTEGAASTVSFYLRKADGTISEKTTYSYKLDKTAPIDTAATYDSNTLFEYLNTASFGLFFKETVTVTLEANDALSGVDHFELNFNGSPAKSAITVNKSDGKFSFHIEPQFVGTFTVTAIDAAGNESPTRSFEYMAVDNKAPTTPTITANASNVSHSSDIWSSGDIELTVSGSTADSGIAMYQYSIDQGYTWLDLLASEETEASNSRPYNAAKAALTLGTNQNHLYKFRAVSNSGLYSGSQEFVVKVDTTTPDIALDAYNSGKWTNNHVSFRLSNAAAQISDTSYQIRIGSDSYVDVSTLGDAWNPTSKTLTLSADANSIYQFKAISGSGLWNESKPYDVKIDKTIPVISVPTGMPETWQTAETTICFTVFENGSGLKSVTVKQGDSYISPRMGETVDGITSYSFTTRANGDYAIDAIDHALNNAVRQTISISKIDTDLPVITSSAISYDEINSGTSAQIGRMLSFGNFFKKGIKLTIPASDATSGPDKLFYKLKTSDGTVLKDGHVSFDHGNAVVIVDFETVKDRKIITVELYATDNAGNQSPSENLKGGNGSDSWIFEDTKPVIGKFKVSGKDMTEQLWLNNSSVSLSSLITDESGIYKLSYKIDGDSHYTDIVDGLGAAGIKTKSYDFSKTITGEGIHNLELLVTDNAMNTSTKSLSIYMDAVKPGSPTVELNDAAAGTNWYAESPTITITPPSYATATAPEVTYYKLWNTSAASGNTEPIHGSVLLEEPLISNDGIWQLKTWTEDEAGNVSTPSTITIKLDTTAADGEIKIGRNSVKSFLNRITFGLFFKNNVEVTISGTDATSGIASIEYYRSSDVLDPQVVREQISQWLEYNGTITETAVDSSTFIYYAKISDNAGNVSYFTSNTATFDTARPVISGITNSSTYYVDQIVSVSDSNLDTITLNGSPFASGSKLTGNHATTYTIDAIDKAGNSSSTAITMKPINSLSRSIDSLSHDNVKSSDRTAIELVRTDVEAVLLTTNNGASPTQIDALNAIMATCNSLLERITEVQNTIHDALDPVKNIGTDNVRKIDLEPLEQAVKDLQRILDHNARNLLDVEINELKDHITSLKIIIDALGTVAGVEDMIASLPNVIDASAIDAITKANAAYNALTDQQKSTVDTTLKTKLDESINALKKAVLFDEATGTKVEGINGTFFDLRTDLRVTAAKDILDKTTMNELARSVANAAQGQEIARLYEIKLLLSGDEIQAGGRTRVTFKLTDEQQNYKDLQVVSIADDGTVTIIPGEISGSELSFITDHFSYYGIIGTAREKVSDIPRTGENPETAPLIAVIFLFSGIFLLFITKRSRRADEDLSK